MSNLGEKRGIAGVDAKHRLCTRIEIEREEEEEEEEEEENKSFIVDRLCTFSPSQIPARTHTEVTPIDFQCAPVDRRPSGGDVANAGRHQTVQKSAGSKKKNFNKNKIKIK